MSDDMPVGSSATTPVAKQQLATELNKAILRAEKQLGRSLDRTKLAQRLNLSVASLYAYLNGTTLPRSRTLEDLLDELHVTDQERGKLSTLRDLAEVAQRTRGRKQVTEAARPPIVDLPVPRQLPTHTPYFVGRVEELRHLTALLDTAAEGSGTVVITAINGTAGIGKTALAVHWAHQVADKFPDGQLYVNLRGFDPSGTTMSPIQAVRSFLEAFEIVPARIPTSLDGQAALYRTLLAGRRVLVVLDNARDTDQVRPLLPGHSSCLVVITSRDQLMSLVAAEGAHPLTLDVLTIDEARNLLATQLGDDKVAAESEAADRVIEHCAHLPLALAIVTARASLNPHLPLSSLAQDLQNEQNRLDALDAGDASVNLRAVFSWSCQQLDEPAQRLFRLLGLHPGPDISVVAAANLASISIEKARETLRKLVRSSLIHEHVPSRFSMHDLLRVYAREQAGAQESEYERRAATQRLLDYYLYSAYIAAQFLESTPQPFALDPPAAGTVPSEIASHTQAMAWCELEHPVIMKIILFATNNGFDTYAWQLPACLGTFFDRRGHWHDWDTTHRIALEAAQRLNDRDTQARIHRAIGQAGVRLRSFQDAHEHLTCALKLFDGLDNHAGQARCHLVFSVMHEHQGHYGKSLQHARQALNLFRTAEDQRGEALALNGVGWYQALLGDHQNALAACTQALNAHQTLGYHRGEAATWDSLGYAHHVADNHTHAIACYRQAITMYQELGDRYAEATTLTRLGNTHQASGDSVASHDAWHRALNILDDLHHPDADQLRARLYGHDRGT